MLELFAEQNPLFVIQLAVIGSTATRVACARGTRGIYPATRDVGSCTAPERCRINTIYRPTYVGRGGSSRRASEPGENPRR